MTRLRDMFATAQEVAALRDRAAIDATENAALRRRVAGYVARCDQTEAENRDLNNQIAALRRRVAGYVARCDQTEAENRDLNNQIDVLARALISLGVAAVEFRERRGK